MWVGKPRSLGVICEDAAFKTKIRMDSERQLSAPRPGSSVFLWLSYSANLMVLSWATQR